MLECFFTYDPGYKILQPVRDKRTTVVKYNVRTGKIIDVCVFHIRHVTSQNLCISTWYFFLLTFHVNPLRAFTRF